MDCFASLAMTRRERLREPCAILCGTQANAAHPPCPHGALPLTSPTPLNRLRKEWREKRPTFGAIATIPSIQTVQIMARSGIDWIIVDLDHVGRVGAQRVRAKHGPMTGSGV